MMTPASILFHPSQFPDPVRASLLDSLQTRRINHKFLYDGHKQTQKWLELHEGHSPARTDPDCATVYEQAFDGVLQLWKPPQTQVIGLGCGGGQKDSQLLSRLTRLGIDASYVAVDVSPAMVLAARQCASQTIPADRISMAVCDLAMTPDLPALLPAAGIPGSIGDPRLFTFFGMIPNFEPLQILPLLTTLTGPRDELLISANLAPGPDYAQGCLKILPQYDNRLTREWLWLFLSDLGFRHEDGEFEFAIEGDEDELALLRIVVRYRLHRDVVVPMGINPVPFAKGEALRLFFSYRHTPATLGALLNRHGMEVQQSWISQSGEEGVFWIRNRRG